MKKLALLLAALGVVSAAAYAAPELTVTHVGQEIESENLSNGSDLDDVWLFNNVGLAYGDWTFGLQAGKDWTINYNDDNGQEKEVKSSNNRLQFDIWNKVSDDLKLGFRYRGQKNYDRFYARYDYSHGMFWSTGDFFYEAKNGDGHDTFHSEWTPLGIKLGSVKVGYYFEYVKDLGGREEGQREEFFEHQIRAYAPLYKGERLTLSTEGRFTIASDEEYNGQPKTVVSKVEYNGYRHFDDFGRNRLYLKANYKLTENLDIYGSYGYEVREWKLEDNTTGKAYKDDHSQKYWQDVVIGWKYTF